MQYLKPYLYPNSNKIVVFCCLKVLVFYIRIFFG